MTSIFWLLFLCLPLEVGSIFTRHTLFKFLNTTLQICPSHNHEPWQRLTINYSQCWQMKLSKRCPLSKTHKAECAFKSECDRQRDVALMPYAIPYYMFMQPRVTSKTLWKKQANQSIWRTNKTCMKTIETLMDSRRHWRTLVFVSSKNINCLFLRPTPAKGVCVRWGQKH